MKTDHNKERRPLVRIRTDLHAILKKISDDTDKRLEGVVEEVLLVGMKVKRILPTEEGK